MTESDKLKTALARYARDQDTPALIRIREEYWYRVLLSCKPLDVEGFSTPPIKFQGVAVEVVDDVETFVVS